MSSRRARGWLLLVGTIGAVCWGTSAAAQSQSTNSSYAAFVAALSAISTAAADTVQNERNAARLEIIRQAVTTKVLAAFPMLPPAPGTPPITTVSLDGALDATSLLCGVRWNRSQIVVTISARDPKASITIDHLNSLAQQNYLNAVAGQLQSLATPPNATDIVTAIKGLFATYAVKVTVQPSAVDSLRQSMQKSCESDLAEFDAAYYGQKIPVAPTLTANVAATAAAATGIPDLSFLGPYGVLANTVIGILQPVLVDFANIADQIQAQQAIKAFLGNSQNQKALTDAGIGLARTTSDSLFAKRLILAGTFAEQIALIGGNSLDLSSKEVHAACAQSATMYERSAGLVSAGFLRCYHAVWAHFEDGINTALKTAVTYDQLADAGDTSTALNKYAKLTANFSTIVQGSDQSGDVWVTVTQMLTFAGAVATAASKSNITNLENALQAAEHGK